MGKNKKWKSQFIVVALGQAISMLGSQGVQFALIWWLAEKTSSPLMLGISGIVAYLPMSLFSPIAGIAADRYNRKFISIFSDMTMGMIALIYAVLLFFLDLPVWTVFVASKLTIIMVYTAISMTIGYICCSSYIIFADKSFNMLEGTFQPSMLRTWIPMAITTVIICMVLSLWSFIIGMIRKSVPATIVTSLIVIVLRQVIITKNTTNQESIMQVILVAIVTVIATLLIFKRKVPELY